MGFEPLGWVARRFGESPLPLSFKLSIEHSNEALSQSAGITQLLETLASPAMWLGWLIAVPFVIGAVMMRHRATA